MTSDRSPSLHGQHGRHEPDDLDLSGFREDAAVAARLRASYSRLPAPDAAQVARCRTAVLAQSMHAPTRRFGGTLRPRWWWGAAALLIVSFGTVVLRRGGPAAGSSPAAQLAGTTTASGHAIRFDLTLPGAAHDVALVGDFNGWDAHATPMARRSNDGAWSAKVPLPPGRHVYAFVVNGQQWLVNPLAPQVPDEGYGPANAVVVDGPR